MAKRRRRKNDITPLLLAAGAVVAVVLVISVIAVVLSNNGKEDTTPSSSVPANTVPSSSSAASGNSEVSTSSVSAPSSSQTSTSSAPNRSELVRDHAFVNGDYVEYTKTGVEELDEWYLLLTNRWNPVGESFEPKSLVLAETGVANGKIDARAYGAYLDMVEAASNDGVNIYGVSIYRTYNYQKNLFERRVNDRMNEGLTREEAEAKVATGTALPGTSEHQIGLAVDFNQIKTSFENTKAGKWLRNNCTDYGFILRYPADKTDITGIIYEPWHFRFVGIKHAKRMEELDMCMEEYVEYIKAGNQ